MQRAPLITIVLLTLALFSATSAHQVVARQGSEDTSKQFQSPMVLEVTLPNLDAKLRLVSTDLANYTCDGVSIRALTVARAKRAKGTTAVLEFHGFIRVPESFDRQVDVTVALKAGAVTVAKGERLRIDAEEDRGTRFRVSVPVDETLLNGAMASDSRPTLEITLVVRDNS